MRRDERRSRHGTQPQPCSSPIPRPRTCPVLANSQLTFWLGQNCPRRRAGSSNGRETRAAPRAGRGSSHIGSTMTTHRGVLLLCKGAAECSRSSTTTPRSERVHRVIVTPITRLGRAATFKAVLETRSECLLCGAMRGSNLLGSVRSPPPSMCNHQPRTAAAPKFHDGRDNLATVTSAPPECCVARGGRVAVAVPPGVAGGVPTRKPRVSAPTRDTAWSRLGKRSALVVGGARQSARPKR
jgi:hypothetical protein